MPFFRNHFPIANILPAILFALLAMPGLTPGAAPAATLDAEAADQLIWEHPAGNAGHRKILNLIREGRPDLAIARLQGEIAAGNDSALVQELLGIAHAKTGRTDKSLSAFARALKMDETRPSAHTNLALVLKAIGRPEMAERHFRRALELDPDDRRAHQNLGLFAAARGQENEAIRHFEAGIRGTPSGYLGIKLDLARLYLRKGRPDDVFPLLGRWEGRENAPETVLVILADAYLALGQEANALNLLRPLAESAETPAPLVRLAQAAIRRTAFVEALETLEQARQRFPDDPGLALELGNLYGAMRRYDKALEIYEEGLTQAPGNPLLHHAAALALLRQGHPEEALPHSRKAVQGAPRNPGHLFLLASLQQDLNQRDAAIASYERAIALAPGNWLFLNNLAALLTPQDPARAVALAERAAEIAPEIPAVQDTLGWALHHAERPQEARAIFEHLRAEAPDNALTAFRLGMVLKALGRKDEARRALERALSLDPQAGFAAAAKRALSED